ncbi:hypothetical protein [Moorena producens]|uniref:hypothetical protein n=1 Tax=Moorena producens TaxID=1155739 RepID=UPI003C77C763
MVFIYSKQSTISSFFLNHYKIHFFTILYFPIPYSLFPVPYSLFLVPDSRFPIPDSRFPIPDSLLGGVRGGFRFPTQI